ncbi:MAG: hypothetical protein K6F89_06745, partial [Prevotella sp.]|nr:hypothetical protein [Prevotella sp.]
TMMPDSVFEMHYSDMMSTLRDGHTQLVIKNLHTDRIITVQPSLNRIKEKNDKWYAYLLFWPSLNHYKWLSEGDSNKLDEHVTASGKYQYGRFADNILYLHLAECYLDSCFNEQSDTYNSSSSKDARKVWTRWFETMQQLHAQGSLRGVIIDVRSNGGGSGSCSSYVFGSLHNQQLENTGCYRRGMSREKNGQGRLEFMSKIPMLWPLNSEEHATITEPIVVMANYFSCSTAEHICLDAKEMENAWVLGTQTFGALSPSGGHNSEVGNAGGMHAYAFELTTPSAAFFTDSGELLEGIGVAPDIECLFDWDLYKSTQRDNQLEKALQFIRAR